MFLLAMRYSRAWKKEYEVKPLRVTLFWTILKNSTECPPMPCYLSLVPNEVHLKDKNRITKVYESNGSWFRTKTASFSRVPVSYHVVFDYSFQ